MGQFYKILKKVYEGQYSIEGEAWTNISWSAKDLVTKMLAYESQYRISAQEALNHQWIQNFSSKTNPSNFQLPVQKRALKNLKCFRSESALQQAI